MLTADIAKALTVTQMIKPAECANTAAATQATGVDVTEYEGVITFRQHVGVVTAGTIVGKIITSDNSNLSSSSDVVSFTSCGTSTDEVVEELTVGAGELKKYVGYVGTITTGPAVVGVTMAGTKKYV